MLQAEEPSNDSSLLTRLLAAAPTESGRSPLMGEFVMDKIVHCGKSFPELANDKIKLEANFIHLTKDQGFDPYHHVSKRETSSKDVVVDFLAICYKTGELDVLVRELERVVGTLISLFEKTGVDLKDLRIRAIVGADDEEKLSYVNFFVATLCTKDGFGKI